MSDFQRIGVVFGLAGGDSGPVDGQKSLDIRPNIWLIRAVRRAGARPVFKHRVLKRTMITVTKIRFGQILGKGGTMLRRGFLRVLFVGAAVAVVAGLSGVLSAQGNRDAAFERVKEVQARHTAKLMAKKGVVGTAVGLNDDGQYAVLILLAKPGVTGIPKKLEDVAARPVVTGEFYALVDRTARFPRPVPTGVSTGHPDITAGTIGCRVTDGTCVYALSNNHVYANENLASIGDPVIQPGTYDGGTSPADDIGTLEDFEPIVFHPQANNKIDAAIALSSTDELDNATPSDGYGIPSSTTADATLGYRSRNTAGRRASPMER